RKSIVFFVFQWLTIVEQVLLTVIASSVNAAEFPGRFVGTIDGVAIDEPISCLGKEPPEAFFQGSNPIGGNNNDLEISGGVSGQHLNLVIRGAGIDLTRIAHRSPGSGVFGRRDVAKIAR
ncbi:hypothetical protein, partial [Thiolapillus sp.]|uniref:hypothetical protein n=1 Tax=Thiolapillus sp. TaxID=2017437 RepID=UPI003AF8581C